MPPLPIDDRSHVAYANACAFDACDEDVGDLSGVRVRHAFTASSRDPISIRRLEFEILRHERARNVVDPEAMAREAGRIEHHANLSRTPSDDVDGSDTEDALDALLHDVVRERRELSNREITRERDGHDRRGSHVELLNHRRFDAGRQASHRRGHAIAHILNRGVRVHLELELKDDLSDALEADRTKNLDATHRVERFFDRICDLRFHRDGIRTGCTTVTVTIGNSTFGKIDADARPRREAKDDERCDEHHREDRSSDRISASFKARSPALRAFVYTDRDFKKTGFEGTIRIPGSAIASKVRVRGSTIGTTRGIFASRSTPIAEVRVQELRPIASEPSGSLKRRSDRLLLKHDHRGRWHERDGLPFARSFAVTTPENGARDHVGDEHRPSRRDLRLIDPTLAPSKRA